METMTRLDALHRPYKFHRSSSVDAMARDASSNIVTIGCGLQEFKVSRSTLVNVSPYFCSALTRGWKETEKMRVDLHAVTGESMEKIIEFISSGKILNLPDDRNILAELLEDADYLQIDDLIDFSYNALADRHLTTEQFCDMYDFIEELNNQKCLLKLLSFLAKNIHDIMKSNDFMLLKPEQLKNILHHVDFEESNMEEIFTSVLRWVEHDAKRCEFLEEAIGVFCRYCWESSTHLVDKHKSTNWSPIILNCLSELSQKQVQNTGTSRCNVNDKSKLVLLGGYVVETDDGNEEEHHLMRVYDVDIDEWRQVKHLPFRLEEGLAIVSYKGHVYLFGGERGEFKYVPSKKVIRYCPLTNVDSTSTAGSLALPVHQAGAGVLRDYIYIVNGVEKYRNLDKTVQRYNPKDGTCKLVASTTYGHYRPHVLPFNDDQLYIVSNSDGDEQFVIERYNLISNQWTMITQIPDFDYWSSAAICKNALVIHSDKFRFQTYDLSTGEWSVKEFKYLKRELIWGLWSIKKNGKRMLYGLDDEKVLHSFDVESMEWETQSCLNMERWGLWGKLYITCL